MKLAFVCVQNAGRSQMATAFAKRERARRGLDSTVEIVTGGTRPADSLHEVVVRVMRERGFELSDRIPREITPEELADCEYVAAMGCTAEGVCPATWSEQSRDWGLDDPHGKDIEQVREIREAVERRVLELFEDLPVTADGERSTTTARTGVPAADADCGPVCGPGCEPLDTPGELPRG